MEATTAQTKPDSSVSDVSVERGNETAESYADFPDVRSGDVVLTDLEHRPIYSTTTLGKYRVQHKALRDDGPVFILTLLGATCSKIRILMWWRELTDQDCIQAMRRAIEREIGYYQNRGAKLPKGAEQLIEITIRDTDFDIENRVKQQ